jgi:uncharacterized membrane protein YvlD (DUF360 family)
MVGLIASALAFAFGLFFVPILIPGMRVRGMEDALKAGLVCGILSAVLGKLVLILLTLVFFLPILLTGPLGAFVVQAMVNAVLLVVAARTVDGISFDSTRTAIWAAVALTVCQTLVRMVGA